MTETPYDAINPKHYRDHASGVETILCASQLGFNIGNAWKYLSRLGKKDNIKQDASKALWYLQREHNNPTSASAIKDDKYFEQWLSAESDESIFKLLYLWGCCKPSNTLSRTRILAEAIEKLEGQINGMG